MTNLNYYLWLQKALGPGCAKTGQIFETFSSAEEIYRISTHERKLSGVFTPAQISKMEDTDIEDTYEIVSECANRGVDILTPKDENYPEILFQLPDYPMLLFVKGSLSSYFDKIPLAIVGTRNASDAGRAAANELAKAVSKCGFYIVSGGAMGIDTAAHTGALCSGEDTIAVLGGAIGDNYLKVNEPLRNVIESHGALISEYPPGTKVGPATFPIRNRLISGLTVGTIVIEAQIASGSLITANHAIRQGRDVMTIDWGRTDDSVAGNNQLLFDGAQGFQMPLDIINEYLSVYPEKIKIEESIDLSIDLTKLGFTKGQQNKEIKKIYDENEKRLRAWRDRKKPQKREITDPLSDEAKRIYKIMPRDPIGIKEISDALCMPMSGMLGALTELELMGYIELLPNTKYVIK